MLKNTDTTCFNNILPPERVNGNCTVTTLEIVVSDLDSLLWK